MDRDEVVTILKEIVMSFIEVAGDNVDDFEIGDDDILLAGEYQISSIALVSIIVEIERQFNIIIDDEYLTYDFLSTISDMADFVTELLTRKTE